MHVNCLDVPRAQGHIEDIKAKYGDASNAYRVRVLGEFPTSDDETVIPLELVLGAVGRNVSSLDYYPVWGVDVARFGDDRTALAKRQANKLLEPVKSWNSTDLMATAGKIKAEYDATPYDLRPREILIDIIGLGAGVYDRCKEISLPVRVINVGEAAAWKLKTAECSEAAFAARARGEKVQIEHVSPLRELTRQAIETINGLDDEAAHARLVEFVKRHYMLVLLTPEEMLSLNKLNRSRMCSERLELADIKLNSLPTTSPSG